MAIIFVKGGLGYSRQFSCMHGQKWQNAGNGLSWILPFRLILGCRINTNLSQSYINAFLRSIKCFVPCRNKQKLFIPVFPAGFGKRGYIVWYFHLISNSKKYNSTYHTIGLMSNVQWLMIQCIFFDFLSFSVQESDET